MKPNDPIVPGWVPTEDGADRHCNGLTKREWLIGQIASGAVTALHDQGSHGAFEEFASDAISLADAIIKILIWQEEE